MRAFGKLAGRVLMALMVVGIAMWIFDPYEDVNFNGLESLGLLELLGVVGTSSGV